MRMRNTAIALIVAAAGFATASHSVLGEVLGENAREPLFKAHTKITLSNAIAIAEKEFPGGRVIGAGESFGNGKVDYRVKVVAEGVYSVRVDLNTGNIRRITQKSVPIDDWAELDALEEAKVTLVQAIAVAERELPGGRLMSASAKLVDGVATYKIGIEKEGLHAVSVDPENGAVREVALKTDD